ncbi:putative secondary metabolism biosynthetic enzyme [Microsporum canis]
MPIEEVNPNKNMQVVQKVYRASSVLLQGNVQTAVNNLFLFPGPFGTSKVFELIPSIDPNFVAVFGLTSVFANIPDQFDNASIPELASLYVAEIKCRQPHGPYSLLGYSVGGTIAYEAARQLIADKEAVERIYLVDSPCPLVIPSIPHNLMSFIGSTQANQQELDSQPKARVQPMSSTGGTPTLGSLEKYRPTPLLPYPGHPIPKTTYYVAKQS